MEAYPEARPEVRQLAPVPHGATNVAAWRRWGWRPDQVLDFSVNTNPFGPSPRVLEALRDVRVDRYPDVAALPLREALARHHAVSVEQVLVGNGVSELIWLVGLAFVRRGDNVLVLEPTYGEYRRATRMMGGHVHTWRAVPEDHFRVDPKAVAARLAQTSYRLVWVCNPNNPTGQVWPTEALAHWAERHPHTLFVVDEAYVNFVPHMTSALTVRRPNVLVLRSMTKDYALPGVRLGYAVGHPDVIATLQRVQPPWSVNAFALAAGLAALADTAFLKASVQQTLAAKADLVGRLRALGWQVVPSATPFFLLHVGDAGAFCRRLWAHGIAVRDGTSFGLPAYVRVGTRRPEENARLVEVLAQWEHDAVRGV